MVFSSYKKWINEKFIEDSDPIHDMGIGIKANVEKWLKRYNKYISRPTINSDCTIDAYDVHLTNINLIKLPDYIQFRKISMDFFIYNCGLITLKGCPEIVGNNFSCSSNNLKSLEYGPKKVEKFYYCYSNLLTNLNGLPKKIVKLSCSGNSKEFSKKYIRSICNVKIIVNI